ncbi:hypothetical protein NDU88_001385 [Pleurodeles waltl]|uniref:Uncharacterized protein n=1 Tax=Pleurodeles waltl TaxID=8319 RepID=A0AAV7TJY0_PLEWA|nr:hypothetical protein NDU88_001385 [Pleurodeles waltl]
MAVKRAVREAGVQYSLLFPARLRVMQEGHGTFFQTLEEAWEWLEANNVGGGSKTPLREHREQWRRKARKRRSGSRPRIQPTPEQRDHDK